MKSLKALALTLVLSTVASFAAAAESAQYGDAGCGLGNVIFGSKKAQISAATTNGSSYTQLFGMTSGTSNCGPSVFSSAEAKAFIDNNAVALENDVVRGQGETLATLSKLMGCDESVLSSSLKNNYKVIYTEKAQSSQKVLETAQKACPVKG